MNINGKNFFFGNVMIVNGKIISGRKKGKKREFRESKSQASENVEKIAIDSACSKINVISTNLSDIGINFFGQAYVDGDVKFDVQVVKRELRIVVEVEGNCYESDFELNVFLPQKAYKAMCIEGCFGNIFIGGADVSIEKLEVKTSSGKIELRKGTCTRQLAVETVSGNVYVEEGYGTERMKVKTSSGKIVIGKWVVSKLLILKTTSGNVNIINSGVENVEVETSSGKINISEELLTKKVKLQTTTGDIDIGAVEVSEELEVKTSSGKIDIGEVISCKKVKIQTTTGDIGIDAGMVHDELEVKTSSGKLKAYLTCANSFVNTTTGDVEMRFNAKQDVKVKISTSSGKVITNFANISCMNLSTKSTCGEVKNCYRDSSSGYTANVDISTVTGNIEVK